MPTFNKVFLMGNLTRDPEVRQTSGGTTICALGLAVNRTYTTAKGEEREETCFVDVEVFGNQAESCRTYLRKGVPVFIEGRLRFDQWDDRETGKKRSRLMVSAERVQFLFPIGNRETGAAGAAGSAAGAGAPAGPLPPRENGTLPPPGPPESSSDQDIPF